MSDDTRQRTDGISQSTALVIMARYPLPGQTKTRLASTLGAEKTARLYHAFLTDLAQRLAGQPAYALHWAYTPAEVAYDHFVTMLNPRHAHSMTCFPQVGQLFATRLLYAFQWTAAHHFQRTVLIGSDTPHLAREVIDSALTALDHAQVVLGPADDGGYYLIAMRQPYDVFSGIPMSTNVVLDMTIAAAHRQGLRVHLLPTLFDIDEEADLQRLSSLLDHNSSLAPATAAYLNSLRHAAVQTHRSH